MMRRSSVLSQLLAAVALTATAAHAQAPAAATSAPERTFAVKCGTLHIGDGATPLRNVWLHVVDGKIDRVGKQAPERDVATVDASNKVVMPGIVAVDSDLANQPDGEYQLTPDALALDAFDFERKWRTALAGGVTSAYLSPGRRRLVSGQGAVVKMAGIDLVARVLSEFACLRVNFDGTALQAPRVFEPTAHPTDEDPLEPARIQLPTARISMLAELRAVFAAATDKNEAPGGAGPAEHRYDEQPLADVIAGKLPMRAGARSTYDVQRALQLQRELGVRMVLEDPQEIAPVAALAAEQKVMATFRMPVRFGQSNPGGEDRLREEPELHFDAPAKAAAAGIVFGLGPAAGVPMRDYLMAVAIAVRHGLEPAHALRAVGIDAARVLGVEQRVGSLEAGKDADFIVLSGPPLAVGTMVESTWIDGKRAFARETSSRVLAVRAGRVMDGTGRVYRNGVVLVRDGRIRGVGEELAIPYGAEVIDIADGVVTPGLVDAFSHLGLAGEGTSVPNGAPQQRLHDAIAFDDPMFPAALAAGITTVLVAGKDSGLASGRLAAMKTGAEDHDGMVLRQIAGQRFVYNAIGPNATKPLTDQIARAKKYIDAWKKYEKALSEWQAGKAKAAAEAKKAPAKSDSDEGKKQPDPISGTWEADIDIQGRVQLKVVLELKLEGTNVTGSIRVSFGGRELPSQPVSGSYESGTLRLEFRGMGEQSATLEATVEGDTMTGTLSLGPMGEQEVTGTRTSRPDGKSGDKSDKDKADDDGKPKAPKVQENLEPLRSILEQRATMVLRTDRAAAIQAVIELLEKEKVSYALAGADDLLDDASLVGDRRPPVIVGPEVVVTEDDGELVNVAATLADRDLPIMFGSGNCAGARFLPLHVSYAVRYGLSPADALSGLTYWPAKAFHLDDRIGSLAKGKDADLVVFSGDPFEPQSRVLLVICNGRVVVDLTKEAQ